MPEIPDEMMTWMLRPEPALRAFLRRAERDSRSGGMDSRPRTPLPLLTLARPSAGKSLAMFLRRAERDSRPRTPPRPLTLALTSPSAGKSLATSLAAAALTAQGHRVILWDPTAPADAPPLAVYHPALFRHTDRRTP